MALAGEYSILTLLFVKNWVESRVLLKSKIPLQAGWPKGKASGLKKTE